jgi:hypothetical protein
MELQTFQEVMAHLNKDKKRPISLLIGNGFSMAYDKDIFSYNALYEFITNQKDELLIRLFSAIKTKNFELIMQQLDTTLALLEAFESDPQLREKIRAASEKLKQGLLVSVKALHPEHVFKVPEEKSIACANFLHIFLDRQGHIFTANYDLLLYWVLMRQSVPRAIDGFGKVLLNPKEVELGEDQEWSELHWGPNQSEQNIHFLHGALHLFDTGTGVEKEQYDHGTYLLEKIAARLNAGEYPIFVTAGDGDEKLAHIRHNSYLSYCYDQLSNLDGSLITFGFNFGQYDDHLIAAINQAAKYGSKKPPKLWSIYIGVYSQAGYDHIKSIESKFHTKVKIFDAKTAPVWISEAS